MTEHLAWKDEGDTGPLFRVNEHGEYTPYSVKNGDRDFTGELVPDWFSWREAELIANDEKLTLEEI